MKPSADRKHHDPNYRLRNPNQGLPIQHGTAMEH
jgi:hypothetical protein